MLKFRFLPKVALADVGFAAYGKTPAALFTNAGQALEEVMVDFQTSAKCKAQSVRLKLKAGSLAELLFGFLNELIFLKDAEQLLVRKSEVRIWRSEDRGQKANFEGWILQAELFGEKINPQRHQLRTDVKAVTKHLFEVKEEKGLWKAMVVLDV